MALKVPVAADHCGFGGGSTNTLDTSVRLGSNSSASSGIESSSLASGGGGGGAPASRADSAAAAELAGGGAGCGLGSCEGGGDRGGMSGAPASVSLSSVSRASAL